jgi:hypothetical protein
VQTIAFRRGTAAGAPYLVLLHSADQPSAHEWNAYVQAVEATLPSARGTLHIFVATDGGAPNAAQRKQLAEAFDRGPNKALTHVFSTSAFVRGVVTAFSWMTRSHALAHAPRELASVCVECRLDPTAVLDDLRSLEGTFVPVQVLQQMHQHAARRASLPRRS